MTIAITGGTGFVGQAVLDEASRRGVAIRALTRREQAPREGVEWVLGDLHNARALADLTQGVSAVLHIAGVVNAPDKAGFEHGNVAGTQNLLDAMRTGQCTRFVCVSSLAAREQGLSDYGHSKRMAEEKVQVSGLDWTIVRPPAVYGPRDTEMFQLFRAAKWRFLPMPPAGRASLIHVGDLARLLLDCAAGHNDAQHGDDWSSRIFEPDDGREFGWAHKELAQAIGAAVGRKIWAPAMPAALLKAAARLDRMIRGGKAKLTPDRARYMVHPDWVSNAEHAVPDKLWQAEIESGQGLRDTAAWYRAQGWI